MEMLGWLTNDLSSAVASYKKIKKIYGETAMIKDEEQPVVLEQVKGDISFEHVSFSIEEKISFLILTLRFRQENHRNHGCDRFRKILNRQSAATFL